MRAVDCRGQTTVITGASSGIGSEFVRQLAARGSHVILVARRRERLNELAAELSAAHGVQATAIPLDLSLPAAGQTLAERVASPRPDGDERRGQRPVRHRLPDPVPDLNAAPHAFTDADIDEFASSYARENGFAGAAGLYRSALGEADDIRELAARKLD